jgi:hypothetical protein
MNPAGKSMRPLFAALLLLASMATAACGSSSTASSSSNDNSNSSPAASAGSSDNNNSGAQLDPAVSLPSSFPTDFPVYSGARPTEQVVLSSGGNTSWEVTWETLDSLDQVQSFYTAQLKQGDWTVSFEGTTNGQYSATFTRKSNTNYGGLMSADNTSKQGVVTISVVLTTSTS